MSIEMPHTVEWRMRVLNYALARLECSLAEKETFVEMLMGGFEQAHQEGIQDAAYIVGNLKANSDPRHSFTLQVVEKALTNLARMNARGSI